MENEQRYFEMTASSNKLLRSSFLYMILGLLVTFLVPVYMIFFNNNLINFVIRGYYAILIAEVILVMVLSARIEKISPMSAKILFFVYSILNGLVFSMIGLAVGDIFLIGYTLAITIVMFGLLAIYGYTTKEDLSNYGGYLKTSLLTLLIVSVLNIFLKAPMLYWIVSIGGVVVFSALTVYDVNKIKQLAYRISDGDPEMVEKLGIIGALELYLDFINIFLYLLRIFSKRRN
ncbi:MULTISPECIES: Bax inhibitor-1/YccA family protein [Fusobacterium]|jgi:FtsH-binding integral membrane protein|uniref:Bax inhibitor-1/YccA family protein n=1 Tax=Fusobacterium TaxID=848 RepID=UPI001F3E6556|nr:MULTISPECIES: Bax inhibitor-1/YccA family protein [Fusobacterium]MCF2612396.1 Bax inhibitor-1/YccA family protein [Fusobacterium perfoetens]MDY2981758.1 Bax inhibitor-1/YccA family protein [Fusobacterium sp.]